MSVGIELESKTSSRDDRRGTSVEQIIEDLHSSFATPHAGTDTETLQSSKTTLNSYSFGIDSRLLPRTNLSYDQFLPCYKRQHMVVAQLPLQLSGRHPGIVFNTPAGQPCARADRWLSNDTFSGWNARTFYLTEELSFQSTYFKNVDLSGRFAVDSAEVKLKDTCAVPSYLGASRLIR